MIVCPRDCYDTCFLEVVRGNNGSLTLRGVKNHLITRGITCPRALADVKRAQSKFRVLRPQVAVEKGAEKFKAVEWKTAVREVALALKRVLKEHGPSAVLVLDYAGNRGIFTKHIPQRLWYLLRAARTTYSICSLSGHNAIRLHYGASYGRLPEDILKSKMIIYWRFNAIVTNLHGYMLADEARRRGARIVVVDPLKTETARKADLWLRIRHGSDGHLALGIANYIVEHELYDKEFIEKYTYGFEEFKEYVSRYSLAYVSEVTGLERSEVVEFAEHYARFKPSIIYMSYGLQRRHGGGEVIRAISLLPALIGIHRGFYYSNTEGLKLDLGSLSGEDLGSPSRIVSQSKIGEHLERGEFKFVFIFLTNPAATYPNAAKIIKGLSRGDVYVVVHETHWTDTARYADIVLPAPTHLEKDDVVYSYWHNYLGLSRRIMKPIGEARTEITFMHMLARELGISEAKIYEDPWNALKKTIGGTLYERLLRENIITLPYKSLDNYPTPTGKIEFRSTKAEELGLPPIPKPELLNPPPEYPYVLISSASPLYIHTQFEDVYGNIPPIIMMSEEDMKVRRINDGDVVIVASSRGEVEMIAKKSERVPPGIVYTYRSCTTLDGRRINEITSDDVDRLGGSTLNSTFVNVRRK